MSEPTTRSTTRTPVQQRILASRVVLWGGGLLLLGAMAGGMLGWLLHSGRVGSSVGITADSDRPDRAEKGVLQRSPIVFSTSPRRPETTPALIPAGVPVVYMFYDLNREGSHLPTISWLCNGRALGNVANHDLRPDPEAPGRGMVLLRAPNGSLAPGLYEVQLTVGGESFLASFQAAWGAEEILQQPVPPAVELRVREATLARGVRADGRPQSPLKVVSPDCGRLYFVFRYEQAEPGIALTVRWFMAAQELAAARREVVLPSTAGWAHAWVEPSGEWPSGEWRVVAYVSGDTQEVASATIVIR